MNNNKKENNRNKVRTDRWFSVSLLIITILIGVILVTSGSAATSVFAVHKSDCPPSNSNETINCPPPPPPKCPPGNDTYCGGGTTHHKKHHGGGGTVSVGTSSLDSRHGSRGGLQQLPSNATDFPGNDPSVIQVHVTSAKKDIIGDYHIVGEITNTGKVFDLSS